MGRGPKRYRAQLRDLHDHGNSIYNDEHCRWLGPYPSGASSIPAPDASHKRMSAACGRRIVEMVWEDLTPDKIMTQASTRNAVTVAMATGCSTNAIIHLIAMARRAGVNLTLDDLDDIGRATPVIANIRPSGKDYLMEDFFMQVGCVL